MGPRVRGTVDAVPIGAMVRCQMVVGIDRVDMETWTVIATCEICKTFHVPWDFIGQAIMEVQNE